MYCPKCKAEYREGFAECADCSVSLVNDLPAEPIPKFVGVEEVLTTKDPGEVALIKSLLEAENIPVIVQGNHFSSLYGHIIPVRFLVPKNKVKEAKMLLSDFL